MGWRIVYITVLDEDEFTVDLTIVSTWHLNKLNSHTFDLDEKVVKYSIRATSISTVYPLVTYKLLYSINNCTQTQS